MSGVTEPATGLQFFELSHEWGHGVPAMPGYEDVKMFRSAQHAKMGVMTHRIRTNMHTGTHVNAPRHLIAKAQGVGEIDMSKLFGSGVVLSIPKGKWELVTAEDLAKAGTEVEPEDIVVINTGWHHKYADSIEYWGHAPGLTKDAAEWLVQRGVKMVAIDTPQIDHPMATSLGPHRNGPTMKRIPKEYKDATGRDAKSDFPEWNPAHKVLLAAGIPTIEQVGGDVDDVNGKRMTFHAYPWNWWEGDACPIRFVGIIDPKGSYRLEPGAAA